jgi:hypothetical protein
VEEIHFSNSPATMFSEPNAATASER